MGWPMIVTAWAWLVAKVRGGWHHKESKNDQKQLAQDKTTERDAAQDEDHCSRRARPVKRGAEDQSAERDAKERSRPRPHPPPPIKILLGPRVDGGTSWTLRPPTPGAWAQIYTELIATLGRGHSTIELVDGDGVPVSWVISWDKGKLVLQHAYTRIEISKRRAEVQISALAAEVEGVRSWYQRELPRAIWWLLGLDVDQMGRYRPGGYLAAIDALAPTVEQRRLEICVDAQGGIELVPGIEHSIISRLMTYPVIPRPGELNGVRVGLRNKNPLSAEIYNKMAELVSKRGPDHGALIERLRRAGLDETQHPEVLGALATPLLRYEVRLWGKALVLDGLDGRRPSTALDDEVIGRFWASALTSIRLVDASHKARRMRDKPTLEAWNVLRAAGGHAKALRLSRVTSTAQMSSTIAHARDRLAAAGANIEELLAEPGQREGEVAVAELEAAIDGEQWPQHRSRARARYEAMLDSVRSSS